MDNGKSKSITKKIKVYGIVQGVGFRPLVYRIAQNLNIKGTVRNVGGYVEIIAQGEEQALTALIEEINVASGRGCEVLKLEYEIIEYHVLTDFIIINSQISDEVSVIPPDLPVCPDCSRELYTDSDRRYTNPFISCMSCGPRYTIIEELPYDRVNTTMRDFDLCEDCHGEYTSPENRRFHAQTISCNDCGPYLIFEDRGVQMPGFILKQDDLKSTLVENEKSTLDNNEKSTLDNNEKSILDNNKSTIDNNKKSTMDNSKKSTLYNNEKFTLLNNHFSTNYCESMEINNKRALDYAVAVLKQGGILAVKGIGGYHYVCSPYLEETVVNLRKLKGREEKPFAVMFPSMKEIEDCCEVSLEERALLESNARPIVLLYMHNNTMAWSTMKSSIYCGAFLPYTPLQILLTRLCGPLIMTSANQSERPIIREDYEILNIQSSYLNGILYNTRRIVRSVDDSVAKVIDKKPQLIRRSRGYVPYPVFLNFDSVYNKDGEISVSKKVSQVSESDEDIEVSVSEKASVITGSDETTLQKDLAIFAAGGDLKAAYCLYKDGNAVVSQYFGDLEEGSVMEEYQKSYSDLCRLLKITPSLAVCDMHPNYHSSRFTKSLKIPVLEVQHHHAHVASVMAEHDLRGRIIGIAFDGTGFGTDGNIWGSEFLVCEAGDFIRAAHLEYNRMIGGDQSMRDAAKTAACYLLQAGLQDYVQDERKTILQAAINNKINTVLTSSMGRLFDAVASILGLGQENHYEGECAALLEREAYLAVKNGINPVKLTFAFSEINEIMKIDSTPVLAALCQLRGTENTRALALGFHYAVAEAIGEVCAILRKKYDSNIVALSGGVFQNTILTEKTLQILRQNKFEVYTNMSVPPNDGAISLGQTYIGLHRFRDFII